MTNKHKAIVRLQIKIGLKQGWDSHCTLSQIRDQAATQAVARIENIIKQHNNITIEGKPTVQLMYIQLED